MNLRFIKPSHNFYNEIMSQWFKYLYILEEHKDESKHPKIWNASDISKNFMKFSVDISMKSNNWND